MLLEPCSLKAARFWNIHAVGFYRRITLGYLQQERRFKRKLCTILQDALHQNLHRSSVQRQYRHVRHEFSHDADTPNASVERSHLL
jgi:hypothetical protein